MQVQKEKKMYKINFSRLVNDFGGASKLARKINRARTIPYQWVKKGKCSTKILEELKNIDPDYSIDDYFEEDHNGKGKRKA